MSICVIASILKPYLFVKNDSFMTNIMIFDALKWMGFQYNIKVDIRCEIISIPSRGVRVLALYGKKHVNDPGYC